MNRALVLVAFGIGIIPMVTACDNCVPMSKEQRAMFRAHSDACLPASGVTSQQLQALYGGELQDTPELRQHVYCVLQRCKVVGKDGKLLKSALMNKKNALKTLEACGSQTSDSPVDSAWSLLRCGLDKKLALFHRMPSNSATPDNIAS